MMSFQKLTTFAALVFYASNSALAAPMPQVPGLPSLTSLTNGVPVVGGLVNGTVGSLSGLVSGGPLGGALGTVTPVVSELPVVSSVIRRDDGLPSLDSVVPSLSLGTVNAGKVVDEVSAAAMPNAIKGVVRRTDDVSASASVPVAPVAGAVPSGLVPSGLPVLGSGNPLDLLSSLPLGSLPVVGSVVPNVLPLAGDATTLV